ncbi:hypothetical protein AAON49_07935 [Pseudotenacibaculum sp. MALMAid0570]|uniref:DUF7935 family protein n=1 Tax=Pseudotenacibaculum sp. MALMAid0570 TaxID=3143938 RepID=UPI0032DF9C52
MEDKILEGLAYALPAIVTGGVAYFIFSGFLKQGNSEKKLELLAEKKKESLPIKLQAYERMLLFCERINPVKLLLRVKPIGDNKEAYLQLLMGNIDQEFEHNMVQQLYITDECWNVIIASKSAMINTLRLVADTSDSANDFREKVLLEYSKKEPQTNTAVAFLKKEVRRLL